MGVHKGLSSHNINQQKKAHKLALRPNKWAELSSGRKMNLLVICIITYGKKMTKR